LEIFCGYKWVLPTRNHDRLSSAFNEPSSPCQSNPSLENLHVELQESPMSITKTPVIFHKSSKGKKPRHDFIPKKSLEDVLDDMKDKVLVVPSPEPVMVDLNEVKIKK
jgi:hypothetical protein